MDLTLLPETFREFSFHVWVNLNSMDQDQQLVEMEFESGVKGVWTLLNDGIETRGLLPAFKLGDDTVVGGTPVVPGLWKHIHADLVDGNLRVSVDAVEVKLPYSAGSSNQKIARWRIGKAMMSNATGLDGLVDGFHIGPATAAQTPSLTPYIHTHRL